MNQPMRLKFTVFVFLASVAAMPMTVLATTPINLAAPTKIATDFDVLWEHDVAKIADQNGKLHPTTIDPELQLHIKAFIAERGLPIAGLVVTDITNGSILAMVQGRPPEKWDATTHTTLFNHFPAASVFKTVVTTAALEMTSTGPDQAFGLHGGCGGQDITPTATWMDDEGGDTMSLRRAFGHSCNGFFAKLAINQLGIGAITHYAKYFGWESPIPIDISIEASRMLPPPAANSTTHTVGRFAAGFGQVGISPMHGAWMATLIANHGVPKALHLLRDSSLSAPAFESPIYSKATSDHLMDIMKETVHNGTASNAFGKGRYRGLIEDVGGKTGTLRGRTPEGLTSLFIGVYPINAPKIAVGAVVVLEDHFMFKAPQLAAEAILAWKQQQERGQIDKAPLELKPTKHARANARTKRARRRRHI